MTRADAIELLRKLQNESDTQEAHFAADAVLCELLESLGCQDVVDEWDRVCKYYN